MLFKTSTIIIQFTFWMIIKIIFNREIFLFFASQTTYNVEMIQREKSTWLLGKYKLDFRKIKMLCVK